VFARQAKAKGALCVLPAIRALDFLCLAECPSLTSVECQYPIVAASEGPGAKDNAEHSDSANMVAELKSMRTSAHGGKTPQLPLQVKLGFGAQTRVS